MSYAGLCPAQKNSVDARSVGLHMYDTVVLGGFMLYRCINQRYAISLLSVFLLTTGFARAQVSIPVSFGSAATCLSQMYTDILWPNAPASNGTYDVNAPTTFANTGQGILGLEIFFEVRPYGYESIYDSSTSGGSEAMASVAVTAINRSYTNNIDMTNYPDDPSLTMAAKDQSPSIWTINKQGTGGLKSTYSSLLKSILNGAPHTQNCDGLMYSWAMGIATYNKYAVNYGSSYVSLTANPTNEFPRTLFFNTNGSTPSVLASRKANLQEIGLANAPKYPSGSYPWYFWTITDATLYGGTSAWNFLY